MPVYESWYHRLHCIHYGCSDICSYEQIEDHQKKCIYGIYKKCETCGVMPIAVNNIQDNIKTICTLRDDIKNQKTQFKQEFLQNFKIKIITVSHRGFVSHELKSDDSLSVFYKNWISANLNWREKISK